MNIVDFLFNMQMNSNGKTQKVLNQRKDIAETKFANILNQNQEIPFDNFMDTIDNCNVDLQKNYFAKGFLMGLSIVNEIADNTKYDVKSIIQGLIE